MSISDGLVRCVVFCAGCDGLSPRYAPSCTAQACFSLDRKGLVLTARDIVHCFTSVLLLVRILWLVLSWRVGLNTCPQGSVAPQSPSAQPPWCVWWWKILSSDFAVRPEIIDEHAVCQRVYYVRTASSFGHKNDFCFPLATCLFVHAFSFSCRQLSEGKAASVTILRLKPVCVASACTACKLNRLLFLLSPP